MNESQKKARPAIPNTKKARTESNSSRGQAKVMRGSAHL